MSQKTGVVDVGGGMRGSFTAGLYDYLNDQGLQPFDYLIGVSAGSANMVTYLAKQRRRRTGPAQPALF